MSIDDGAIAPIQCPKCQSTSYRKSGRQKNRQRYLCKNCGKLFLELIPENWLLSQEPRAPLPETNGSEASVSAIAENLNSIKSSITTDFNHQNSPVELPLNLEVNSANDIPPNLPKTTPAIEANPHQILSQNLGLAILLLDAENLKFDLKAEQYLESLCHYKLQVKIAFANWRNPSLTNQDAELHKRGYQLIHVPSGANNADGKMIAVGSSIFLRYPTAKEVFVCSSDSLLIHLCNELESQGLKVYRVWRQDKTLIVETCKTGELKYYSLAIAAEIPDFQDLVNQLKEWVSQEQTSLTEKLTNLGVISSLFQARSQTIANEPRLTITQENIDIKNHKIPLDRDANLNLEAILSPTLVTLDINSRQELEKALIDLLKELEIKLELSQILVGDLGVAFSQKYGKSASILLRELGITGNLTEFLKSCSQCKVTGENGKYRVAIAPPSRS